jgi:tetratricopeptide (TPR) repeat protein
VPGQKHDWEEMKRLKPPWHKRLIFLIQKNVPAYAELHRIAGETYIALGDTDSAHGHFQKAAEIDPNGRIGKLAQAALERLQIDQK